MAANIPFEDIILSDIFEFKVGTDQTSIKVNSKAISRLSRPLDTLMNGRMKEAKERCAVFQHLEVPDFVRLCQFAYTGDYMSPTPEIDESRPKSLTYQAYQHQSSNTTKYCYCSRCGCSNICQTTPTPKFNGIKVSFSGRNYTTDKIQAAQRDYTVRSNSGNSQIDYGPLLLSHAVLYAFGEEYDIPDLKSLAIFRIHRVLQAITLYETCLKDIVTLIGFVYSNTKDGSADPLRELVTEYAVKEFTQLNTSKEFRELLVENREFVADYMRVIMTLI